MTEVEMPALQSQPAQHIQVWVESFAQVLGQIAGSPIPCVALHEVPAEIAPSVEGDLWAVCACAGGLRGEMSMRLPGASVLGLARDLHE